MDKAENPFIGWQMEADPLFWIHNGYVLSKPKHYYGCECARLNKRPVYRKTIAVCSDSEDYVEIVVFCCGVGCICHEYMAYLLSYNNAGGTKYEVDSAFQFQTVDEFNKMIALLGFGETYENGESFYIKKVSKLRIML